NHMLTGADPAPAVCDDAVLERNLRLGSDLQITGTPHIIFSNGERFAGAMPIERLREALASQ
ncbi:MAG: thioredoxin fold domain-containing protein, partial [Duodenibacillus sp.]